MQIGIISKPIRLIINLKTIHLPKSIILKIPSTNSFRFDISQFDPSLPEQVIGKWYFRETMLLNFF
jgi:hypothetical protein